MKRGISEGSLPKIDPTLVSGVRSHHAMVRVNLCIVLELTGSFNRV